ncbi:MAG: RDD family protein [Dermatophilaceae bacterium]
MPPDSPGQPAVPPPPVPQPTEAAAPYPVPPQANPYGGPTAAPVYVGGGEPAQPGNRAYVEQHFGPVADFGKRALAQLIDGALVLLGFIPAFIGIIIIVVGAAEAAVSTVDVNSFDQPGAPVAPDVNTGQIMVGSLLIALGSLLGLAIAFWNRCFRAGRSGQSVGKSVVGLMLINATSGQPIGVGTAFLRDLTHGVVNQLFYLSFLWMLWDVNKQTVGDKAVSSAVIVVPKNPA